MQGDRAVHVGHEVVDDAHGEGSRAGVAVRPTEGTGGRRVIRAGHARVGPAVRGGVIDADAAKAAVGADDGDRRQQIGFRVRERGLAEADLAGAEFIVENCQHRIGQAAQGHAGAEGLIGRAEQRQVHRLGRVGQQVVDDADGEGLVAHVPIQPVQNAVCTHVIHARLRRQVARRILHAVGIGGATQPHDGDRHRAAIFRDAVVGHAEIGNVVVVRDRHGRRRWRTDDSHTAIEGQGKGTIHIGRRVRIENRHQEVGAHLAVHEREHVGDSEIVRAGPGRHIRRPVRHRQAADETTQPLDRDQHRRPIFRNRVARRAVGQHARAGVVAAIDPHQIRLREAVERGERTAEDDPVILELHERGLDIAIRARAEVDAGIDRARRGQPHHARMAKAVDGGEATGEDQLAVGLHGHGVDVVVRGDAERGIRQACQRHPGHVRAGGGNELPADHQIGHAPEHLHADIRDRADRAAEHPVGREGRIHRPVGEHPRQARRVDAVDLREAAAEDETAIPRQNDGRDGPVGRGREGRVQRSVRAEAGHEIVGDAIDRCERSANHDLAIWLQGDRFHRIVRSRAGREAGVQQTAGGQPHQAIHRLAVNVGEETAGDNLAVRLQRQRFDQVVGGRHEGGIRRSIHIQPGDVVVRDPVDLRERTADDQFARQGRSRHARAVKLRVGVREAESTAPKRAGDQGVAVGFVVENGHLRIRDVVAQLVPGSQRGDRREIDTLQRADHHTAHTQDGMRDQPHAEEFLKQGSRDVDPRRARIGGLIDRTRGNHIEGHPVQRVHHQIPHRAAGEARRRRGQNTHRIGADINRAADPDVEDIRVGRTTERATVGNARTVRDTGADFRQVVALIEGLINGVRPRDDQPSTRDLVGLDRRIELRHQRGTGTTHGQSRHVDRHLSSDGIESPAVKEAQVLVARIEHRESRADQRIHGDIPTIARGQAVP